MNADTRNALLIVLILMTTAIVYGFFVGGTPETKMTLAMMYGATVGVGSCVILLLALPVIEAARSSAVVETQEDKRRSQSR